MKTSDLTGPALDWAVANALGRLGVNGLAYYNGVFVIGQRCYAYGDDGEQVLFEPDVNWSQGGPIIEREGIGLDYYEDGGHPDGGEWGAATNEGTVHALGPTPLIAAMRCFVASRLGDEVDIPEELR